MADEDTKTDAEKVADETKALPPGQANKPKARRSAAKASKRANRARAAGIGPDDKTDPAQTRADAMGAAVPRVPTVDAPRTTTVDPGSREGAIRARGEALAPLTAERAAKKAKRELTEPHSHKAVKRGYANGIVVEPGDFVPAGVPVSDFEGDTPGQSKEAADAGYEGWMLPADHPMVEEAIAENTA